MRFSLLAFVISSTQFLFAAMNTHYSITIKNPNTHYAEVNITLSDIQQSNLQLHMPVWTPGSYMVREFEKHIEGVQISQGRTDIAFTKTNKQTWAFTADPKRGDVNIHYKVYCFEQSIRTSYIDAEHAFLLPSSCLMYIDGMQNGQLSIVKPEQWQQISCTLKPGKNKSEFEFTSLDELYDSPIEIGNQTLFDFEVEGVKHSVAMVGKNNCQIETFKTDLQKICITMKNIIGSHPCKNYLFIVHHVEEGGGGLEHANSNVVQMPRNSYSNREKYLQFLGLCAHEYFHLWNVKRLRPEALGPFDYSQENYTNMLWVAEGITSYYDELAMYRAGFRSESDYLKSLAQTMSACFNRVGGNVQSMHEASFDAWIKEYRPNENSINAQISYYLKGAVLGALLDLDLLNNSNGQKGLDLLMQGLYKTFYLDQNKGYSDQAFYKAIDDLVGKPLQFEQWATTPNTEAFKNKLIQAFEKAGMALEWNNSSQKHFHGIITEWKNEKLMVKAIDAQSINYQNNLQAGDEIIAVEDLRVKNNFEDLIRLQKENSKVNILISRAGLIQHTSIELQASPKLDCHISIKDQTNATYKAWLNK